jgi:hypothetical protein
VDQLYWDGLVSTDEITDTPETSRVWANARTHARIPHRSILHSNKLTFPELKSMLAVYTGNPPGFQDWPLSHPPLLITRPWQHHRSKRIKTARGEDSAYCADKNIRGAVGLALKTLRSSGRDISSILCPSCDTATSSTGWPVSFPSWIVVYS